MIMDWKRQISPGPAGLSRTGARPRFKGECHMYCTRKLTEQVWWVGGSDRRLALFENLFPITRGVSYNSYLILDEQTAVVDTVDSSISRQFLENVLHTLDGRPLDYLVINHMEPDHCASIETLLLRFPTLKLVGNAKTFAFMGQFYDFPLDGRTVTVKEGDTLSLGGHTLHFHMTPMVHWPEVMMTYESSEKLLFSADAFGSFGALDGKLFNDEVDFERDWIDDARRYYTNIVGKYGAPVQALLKKASGLDIKMICPLHGPVWRSNVAYFIEKYDRWSRYEPEEKGVMIAYASMYGNTEAAAQALAAKLCEKGMTNVVVYDVSNTHVSQLISEAFRLSHIVLASVTYNLGIYPVMHNFLSDMKALNLQKRTFALIENGSWACKSGDLMQKFIEEEMKNMTVINERLSLASTLHPDKAVELDTLADGIIESMQPEA